MLNFVNMSKKVNFFDLYIRKKFYTILSIISTIETFILIGINIETSYKIEALCFNLLFIVVLYLGLWIKANTLNNISITINRSRIDIGFGNIFDKKGLKVIAFNEYFDTIVDNIIVSENTLNGKYLNILSDDDIKKLNNTMAHDHHLKKNIVDVNKKRKQGKKNKYKLGSIYKHGEFLLTAFSRFDDNDRAYLYISDLILCLLNFWDEIDIKNSGHTVCVPLLGTGITRLKEYIDISEQELLEIILWTLKISRIKITHPARLCIVIHPDKIEKINLHKIKYLFG